MVFQCKFSQQIPASRVLSILELGIVKQYDQQDIRRKERRRCVCCSRAANALIGCVISKGQRMRSGDVGNYSKLLS